MSRYAEVPDLINAWNKVHTSALSHDEMRTMLERASNLIDSELARRYAVPFTSPYPPRIRDLTVDLAMMDVLYRSEAPPPFVAERIKMALEALTRIRDGEVGIVGGDAAVVPERSGFDTIQSNTSDYVPVFGAVPSLAERSDPQRRIDEDAARGVTGYDVES